MGKRIIQRARGKGSMSYRVRRYGYRFEIGYPNIKTWGKAKVVRLINSPCHSAPIALIKIGKEKFYDVTCEKLIEGQEINIGKGENDGDICAIRDIEIGKKIFNIESTPGDGGKFVRSGGSCATVLAKEKYVKIAFPSGKTIELDGRCRATLGIISGAGRQDKPFVKAGTKHHLMKSRNKLWPRTSAVKMNVCDHPFGSGRGKNVSHGRKGKIAKTNAPAGARVGLIRPRRTGRRKR